MLQSNLISYKVFVAGGPFISRVTVLEALWQECSSREDNVGIQAFVYVTHNTGNWLCETLDF